MNKKTTVIMPQTMKILETMGEQIKLARLRRRLSVRGRGAVRQCGVVSVDARPACDGDRRHPDVDAGRDGESRRDGRLGMDRRGAAHNRLAAALRWTGRRPASARSCHLAPLPEGGGAESESARGAAPPFEGAPLRGGFPGRSVPVES